MSETQPLKMEYVTWMALKQKEVEKFWETSSFVGDDEYITSVSENMPVTITEAMMSLALHVQQSQFVTTDPELGLEYLDDELEDSESWLVNGYFALLSDELAKSFELLDEEGNWNLPKWDLDIVKQTSTDGIVGWYEQKLGTFQNLADVWGSLGRVPLNRHDITHITAAYANLKDLWRMDVWNNKGADNRFSYVLNKYDLTLEEEYRAEALALAFHDSGMAFAGRYEHEKNAFLVLERVFGKKWTLKDPFCRRVEFLIENHTTKSVDMKELSRDPGLGMLILADESHLENRLTSVGSTPEGFVSDPWIRISKDVINSRITVSKQELIWHIETSGQESERYQQLGLNTTHVVNDISNAIFSREKISLLKACAHGISGKGNSKVFLSVNQGHLLLVTP